MIGSNTLEFFAAPFENVARAGASCLVFHDGRLDCRMALGPNYSDVPFFGDAYPLGSDSLIAESGVAEADAGPWAGCFLDEEGRVYCFGNNEHGRIGQGVIPQRGFRKIF